MDALILNGVTVRVRVTGRGFYRNGAPGHCSVAAQAANAVRSLQNGNAEAKQRQGHSPVRGETKHNAHPQFIRAWLILAIVNLVGILLIAVLAAVVYYRILDAAVLFFAQLLHGLASP